MDRIATTTSLISGIVVAYDQKAFQVKLNATMKELCEWFEKFLEENAEDAGLITENTIRPVPYYSVGGRVKETDSFHEKMIRGNLIFKFLEKSSFRSKGEIIKRKAKAQEIIKEISDDLIGIKILTGVEEDCKKVLKLLIDKHSINFANKKKLWLSMDDLNRQPDKMRNGLRIYKVKGVFRETFQFELQIKSKLLSVWGDMDHAMFYKDYSVSPVKKNVMDSMVNLGNLITQVDHFLLHIREAEKTFSDSRSVIDFTEKFSEKYGDLLKEKLGFGYRLEEISEFLFYLFRQLPKEKKFPFALDFSILNIRGADEFNRHYIRMRNKNINLQIIELIFFNWFSSQFSDRLKKSNNYNRLIPVLYGKYIEFLSKHLIEKNESFRNYLETEVPKLFIHFSNAATLYNFEKSNRFFDLLNAIITYSDIDVVFSNKGENLVVRNFIYLTYFKHNAVTFLRVNGSEKIIEDLRRILDRVPFDYQKKKIEEIEVFNEAGDLIQDCLLTLKDL